MNDREIYAYECAHNEYGGIAHGVTSKNYKKTFFKDTLRIVKCRRGRSAAQFVFESQTERSDNKKYHMFMKDVLDLIRNNILNKGKISGKWGWRKRGCNFGIYFVGDKDDTK